MNLRKYILSAALLGFSVNSFADANSSSLQVASIESRDSGYHALFLSGSVPDENCTLKDRAIILESSDGGKTMLSISLSALTANKSVVIRVSGCTVIDPSQTQHTAPRVTKVQIYN